MDIVDRLFELVDQKFKEQRDFAAAIGVDASLISRWRNRKSASYVKRLEKISKVLGTTPQYLLSGDGPEKENTFSAVSDSDTISEEEYVLLHAYRRADAHTQSLINLALEPFK